MTKHVCNETFKIYECANGDFVAETENVSNIIHPRLAFAIIQRCLSSLDRVIFEEPTQ